MRISKVSLFFFIISFNYIFLRMVVFPFVYDTYGGNGIIYILLIFISLISFFLFLPKRFFTKDFSLRLKESKIKHIFNIYFFLRIIIGITLGCYVLHELFFYKFSYYLLPIGLLAVIFLLSSLKPSEVIQISTLFGIAILLCYFLYFYNFINIDFSLIFKDFNFNFNIMLAILPYCLIFDNFIYFLADKDKLTMDKKTIVFALIVTMILFIFEYGILTLSSGGELYKDYPLSGFSALSIEPVSRYNGNFDYIYILMIVIACVFKYSFFFSLIEKSSKKSFSKFKYVFLFIIIIALSIAAYFVLQMNYDLINYFTISLLLFGGLIFLWLIKEIIYARKIKE